MKKEGKKIRKNLPIILTIIILLILVAILIYNTTITGNAIAKTYDCSASLGKTTFTGFYNTIGLNNGDTRFVCFNQRFYECGWELNNDKFAKKMKNNKIIGNYKCDLTNKKFILIKEDCEKASGANIYTGKNGQIGLNNGDPRFLCLNNTFYECGWESPNPNFAVKTQNNQVVENYKCQLNSKRWIKKDVVCEQDSDCGTNIQNNYCSGDLNKNITLCQNSTTYKCNNPGTNASSCSEIKNSSCTINSAQNLACVNSQVLSCGSSNAAYPTIQAENNQIIRNSTSYSLYCDIPNGSWKEVISVNSCMFIQNSGVYELSRDLTLSSSEPTDYYGACLFIKNTAKNVILDGRGYSISYRNSTSKYPSAIVADTYSVQSRTIIIKNFMTISNFVDAIVFPGEYSSIQIQNSTIKNCIRGGIRTAEVGIFNMDNCEVSYNGGTGVIINEIKTQGTLLNNKIISNKNGGVLIWEGSKKVSLKGNTIKNNGYTDIRAY